MPTEILMPALSPTMEEGKLAKWLVKEGQSIKPGDIIAEIETDKATMEVEAVDEGKVSKLLISEGTEGVKVNTPIAVLLAEGEKDGAPTVAKAPSAPGAPFKGTAPTKGSVRPTTYATGSPPPGGEGLGVGGTINRRVSPPPQPSPTRGEGVTASTPNGHGGRIVASPLARRLAREAGIDLAALTGTGPH